MRKRNFYERIHFRSVVSKLTATVEYGSKTVGYVR